MGNEGADRRLAHQDSPDSLQALMLLESPCPASRHHLPTVLPIAGKTWHHLAMLESSQTQHPRYQRFWEVLRLPSPSLEREGRKIHRHSERRCGRMTPIHIGIAATPIFLPITIKMLLTTHSDYQEKRGKPLANTGTSCYNMKVNQGKEGSNSPIAYIQFIKLP